ncbi:hypothetical protein N9R79_06510 [Vibrio sp.]|nr:hypothetical protein [Vibrio sp.]
MMNLYKATITPVMIITTLFGCSVEEAPSEFVCTQVSNHTIDLEAGDYTDVYSIYDSGTRKIGYVKHGDFYLHSECSASLIEYQVTEDDGATGDRYSWYEYGAAIHSQGIHSIQFYISSEQHTASVVTRKDKEGQWDKQWQEEGRISKMQWNNEQLFDQVTVVNQHNGADIREVTVVSGTITKTKRYDASTQDYQCTWDNEGVLTIDSGCVNEESHDVNIIGVSVDSDAYEQAFFSAQIGYETDEQVIIDDINRFF